MTEKIIKGTPIYTKSICLSKVNCRTQKNEVLEVALTQIKKRICPKDGEGI